ncbi:MAG TPA: type III pantothenate kinase, partial [Alphaproteobacteria bacterium]|nr:type III pantothenate kinase [Alphaproteobacteria bacterium]
DCGNTDTVIGLYEGEAPAGRFRHVYRIATDPSLGAANYRERFDEELEEAELGDAEFEGAAIACVVPDAQSALMDFAEGVTGSSPVVVGALGNVIGCDVLVDQPGKVGADRLVNALAAFTLYPGPSVVVDFGTATTFDVISPEGAFAGGVIAPGVPLALKALHESAALLPEVEVARPERVIGHSTVEAMQSGIYWGYVALIEGTVARIRAEAGFEAGAVKVIGTGGLAPLFADGTDVMDAIEPELTLLGLMLSYRINRPS